MKPEKLYELLGGIDENLLERAAKSRKTRKKAAIIRIISVAACLVLVITGVSIYAKNRPVDENIGYLDPEEDMPDGSDKGSMPEGSTGTDGNNSSPNQSSPPIIKTLGLATYPTIPKKPDYNSPSLDEIKQYSEYYQRIMELETDNTGNYEFVSKTLLQFLKNKDGQNFVYSPSTLYFSLSMLSECAKGNTQNEILALLGKNDIENVRNNTHHLWQKLYVDGELSKSVSANSLWLANGYNYNQSTIDILKNSYFASSYSGSFASDAYTQEIQNWINTQTGGLLKESVQKEEFDPATVMALVTTTYFKSTWTNKFSDKQTAKGTFHAKDGDITCDFMHSSDSSTSNYYWSDSFSAVTKSLDTGSMTFILPDEDKTIDDLLRNTSFLKLVTGSYDSVNTKNVKINLSIPKFDITADLDLVENLKSLGIKDAFSDKSADFSPVTTELPLYLNKVSHASRVKIDEEGCEAASYIINAILSSGMPPGDEVDFVLDRPFIFVVSGMDNLPRFIGVVNQP